MIGHKESIESRKFWLAVEELTLLLKGNHRTLISLVRNIGNPYIRKEVNDKDVEILKLELENLSYKIREILEDK